MIPDRVFLLRALAGNLRAATELFARHAPALEAWARPEIRRRFDDRVDPDDVLQDFYEKVCADRFRVLARWNGLEDETVVSIEPYLKRVLQNLVLDEARRTYARWGRESDWNDEAVEGVPDAAQPVPAVLAAEELRRALWACIERLSERRRDVVRLLVAGVPHEEIALRLAIEANASRARLHQSMAQLRDCLVAAGHHELAAGSV